MNGAGLAEFAHKKTFDFPFCRKRENKNYLQTWQWEKNGYDTQLSRKFFHLVYMFSFAAAKLSFTHISGTQVVWIFCQDPSLFAFPFVFVFSLKQWHVLARSNHELFSLTAGVPRILERLPYLLSPSVFFPEQMGSARSRSISSRNLPSLRRRLAPSRPTLM